MKLKQAVRRDRARARAKAEALVAQMTRQEKCSQMLHRAPAIERLGIPAYNWWGEALHGVARAGTATVFPQAIGLAATFDPELLETLGQAVATEGRAKYHAQFRHGDHDIYKGLTFWAPNVNIFRDPRWGRGHETFGEDPELTGALGVAYIRGLQGDDPDHLSAAACAKHFAVHSGPEDLRHAFNAEATVKDMRETYLPAFEACVKEGQVEAVMGAYNRVNGEAACASKVLLQDILRDEWGFAGHVVSDCWAIKDIYTFHGLAETAEEAVALAVSRGCDLNCGESFIHLEDAIEDGLLDEDAVTEAVTRLFTTRFLLGILGEDTTPWDDVPYEATDSPEHRRLNREAAQKVPVLLKNDGVLPLDGKTLGTVGVIGPNADNRKALVGNYEGTSSRYVTVLEGIQNRADRDGFRVLYSEGCDLYRERLSGLGEPNDRISEVKAVCEASDVVVAVMGLDATLEGEEGDTGNQYGSGDKRDLSFPGLQRDVLETAYRSGKPVILVVLSGSCLALDRDQEAEAILQGWYPGAQGGHALADILFGDVSPEGKLPLTFYASDYAMPDFTDYRMEGRTYRFTRDAILYPFGFGLSYVPFTLDEAEASGDTVEDTVTIRCRVTNHGDMAAAETVQVYVEAPDGGTPFPALKGFAKIRLEAGETGEAEVVLERRDFAVIDDEGKSVYPEGTYRVHVGFSQPDALSRELTGQDNRTIDLYHKH